MGRYVLIQGIRLPFNTAAERKVALRQLETIGPFPRIAIVWRDDDGVAEAVELIRVRDPEPRQ